ncbi:MAG: class A beta-lactamase-related serine hydrolase [Oxalobacteraceae bacterium]|nr:MAG: class A beta-lactamase-related serine hydrolase [Oxalobacteraceae bacterium]
MRLLSRVAIIIVAATVLLALWTGIVGAFALGGWWRNPIAPRGDAAAFLAAASNRIDAENRGNAALVVIEKGRVVGTHYRSVGAPVAGDTLFQVASLSKWITAWGVMTLVEEGRLDLDAPVSNYLTRWRLPPSSYNDQVTVRRILSHTAGFTDGLGYDGFAPGVPIQSLEDSLTHAADADAGVEGAVRVSIEPGTEWHYSGGGYTILQLLVEEVSGEPFNAYMRRAVLTPLGMTQSTYVLDDQGALRVAAIYGPDGVEVPRRTFTSVAAASLYTSSDDMTRFLQAQSKGPDGEPIGRGVLNPETVRQMRDEEGSQYGFPIWGLGQVLYSPSRSGGFIVGHDGTGSPAVNTTARIDPDNGDGILVLETGSPQLATDVGGAWVLWQAGEVDLFTVLKEMRGWLSALAIGAFVVLIGAVLAGIFWGRVRTRPQVSAGPMP